MIETESATLSDALVSQKNEILYNINYADTPERLTAAMRMLEFAAILWNVAGYGYKFVELKARVKGKADAMIQEYESKMKGKGNHANARKAIEKLNYVRGCMS